MAGRRCGGEKMWRGEDVAGRRCGGEKMWRGEDVAGSRCDAEKMSSDEFEIDVDCKEKAGCLKYNDGEWSSNEFVIGVEIKTVDNDARDKSNLNAILNSYSEVWTINESPSTDWMINLDVNGPDVKFNLDTGSQCNVSLKGVYLKLVDKPKLKPTNTHYSI